MINTILINDVSKNINIPIPLTQQTGKIRVKNRDIWYGYGQVVATRQQKFNSNCYIEWQIGYDVVTSDKDKLVLYTLPNKKIYGTNKKEKALYELSEYLYYFYHMNIISLEEIENLLNEIKTINHSKFIEQNI